MEDFVVEKYTLDGIKLARADDKFIAILRSEASKMEHNIHNYVNSKVEFWFEIGCDSGENHTPAKQFIMDRIVDDRDLNIDDVLCEDSAGFDAYNQNLLLSMIEERIWCEENPDKCVGEGV